MEWCFHFHNFPTALEGFCDANRVIDNDEVSSTSGYVFTLGGGVVSWMYSKTDMFGTFHYGIIIRCS